MLPSSYEAHLTEIFWQFSSPSGTFVIYADQRSFIGALSHVSEPWTARQQHHLSYISKFLSYMRHVSGEATMVADTLSRPAHRLQPSPL
jgi:hypothetical protein